MSKTTAETPNVPTKHLMEADILVLERWKKALLGGTFKGEDCPAIAGLTAWVEKERVEKLAEYEAESLKHPEWGRPKALETAGVA